MMPASSNGLNGCNNRNNLNGRMGTIATTTTSPKHPRTADRNPAVGRYLSALPAEPSSWQASTTRAAIEVSASRPHERGS
ncbi:hypothetical protein Uis4E_0613 [Bifidobacterium parmae]|uniref:Uncharacterized protein n=1 Tax=Bifidobacterium parmae TaxID=361854 RepID=A0A2N5J4R9_9BIFI|nr:hypothetical protein Uis4E_0613 [Bifidobacterium parmae]